MDEDTAIWDVLYRVALKESVDFKDNIQTFIKKCTEAGGTPSFVTEFGGGTFHDYNRGTRMLLGYCSNSGSYVEPVWFNNVPDDVIALAENRVSNWENEIKKRYGIG